VKTKVPALALFAAIVLLSLDPLLLEHSVPPGRPSADALRRRADPNPDLAVFLAGVQARTRRGDSIVVVLPSVLQREEEAYRFRASYHLAGRDVLPLVPENVRRATYVAAWRVPVSGGLEVWSGHGGVLVRQR
jgi:hypothetical protein